MDNHTLAAVIAMSKKYAGEITSDISADIAQNVTEWLDTHVDPETGYVIDDTLTIQGAAADAKKTGDELTDLKNHIGEFENAVNGERISVSCVYEQGSLSVNGEEEANVKRVRSDFVDVSKLSSISFVPESNYRFFLFWYDDNKTYKTRTDTWQISTYNLAKSNYKYMRWVVATINDATPLTPTTLPSDALVITALEHTRVDDNANAIKNLLQNGVYVGTTGESEANVSAPNVSNEVNITIPSRLLVFGYGAIPQAFENTGGKYTLSHNDILYLNITTGLVAKSTVSALASVTDDIAIIGYNNKGRILGSFSHYQQRTNDTGDFVTTIFCNRQGDIDGCPVNSNIGFKRAKDCGYNRVRGSLCYTSDGVGVMWHDRYLNEHIDGNKVYDSNGNEVTTPVDITALTYAELQTYDFGKDKGYDGLEITTFENFVKQAVTLGYEIDVELKFGLSTANIENALDIVAVNGMCNHTMWIANSDNLSYISHILEIYPYACVAYGTTVVSDSEINKAIALKTSTNKVWFATTNSAFPNLTDTMRKRLAYNNIRVKYCSLYTTSVNGITDVVKKADMVEIAYLKNPSWYFTHTNFI